jgi:hypothetical protein
MASEIDITEGQLVFATVAIRSGGAWNPRAAALALSGRRMLFEVQETLTPEDTSIYVGERRLQRADWKSCPIDEPLWIASGDTVEISPLGKA